MTRPVDSWVPNPADRVPSIRAVRAMFYGYLAVIVTGVAYFSVIGLTHH